MLTTFVFVFFFFSGTSKRGKGVGRFEQEGVKGTRASKPVFNIRSVQPSLINTRALLFPVGGKERRPFSLKKKKRLMQGVK